MCSAAFRFRVSFPRADCDSHSATVVMMASPHLPSSFASASAAELLASLSCEPPASLSHGLSGRLSPPPLPWPLPRAQAPRVRARVWPSCAAATRSGHSSLPVALPWELPLASPRRHLSQPASTTWRQPSHRPHCDPASCLGRPSSRRQRCGRLSPLGSAGDVGSLRLAVSDCSRPRRRTRLAARETCGSQRSAPRSGR